MGVRALKRYLQAHDAVRVGNRKEAAQALAESLGASAPTHQIEASLDILTRTGTTANDAVLNAVVARERVERRKKRGV